MIEVGDRIASGSLTVSEIFPLSEVRGKNTKECFVNSELYGGYDSVSKEGFEILIAEQPGKPSCNVVVVVLNKRAMFVELAAWILGTSAKIHIKELVALLKNRWHITTLPQLEAIVHRLGPGENKSDFFCFVENRDESISAVTIFRNDSGNLNLRTEIYPFNENYHWGVNTLFLIPNLLNTN